MNLDRMCKGKYKHPNREAARKAIKSLARKYGSRAIAGMDPYACTECRTWHTGHMPVAARPTKNRNRRSRRR